MKIKDLMISCEDLGFELKTLNGNGPGGATIGLDLGRPSGTWMWFHTVADLKEFLKYYREVDNV